MTNTAEYWNDVKSAKYLGSRGGTPYTHLMGYNCGHAGSDRTADINKVDCPACLKLAKGQHRVPNNKPPQNSLPKIFKTTDNYEYQHRKVKYIGRGIGVYKFAIENGANLEIDPEHVGLIFRKTG